MTNSTRSTKERSRVAEKYRKRKSSLLYKCKELNFLTEADVYILVHRVGKVTIYNSSQSGRVAIHNSTRSQPWPLEKKDLDTYYPVPEIYKPKCLVKDSGRETPLRVGLDKRGEADLGAQTELAELVTTDEDCGKKM